jgi:hypothetical protein
MCDASVCRLGMNAECSRDAGSSAPNRTDITALHEGCLVEMNLMKLRTTFSQSPENEIASRRDGTPWLAWLLQTASRLKIEVCDGGPGGGVRRRLASLFGGAYANF